MSENGQGILFENVSKFYGEVLGVNRVQLTIPPGITSLVGPNGSGKTTLMNLITGLLQPTEGEIRVLGIAPTDPEALFRRVGYCTQFDAFPKGTTGRQFIEFYLRVHGLPASEARKLIRDAGKIYIAKGKRLDEFAGGKATKEIVEKMLGANGQPRTLP